MPNSLLTLRRACAVELGPHIVGTTSSVATDTSSFVASTLINSNVNVSRFVGCWAYFLTAPHDGVQRETLRDSGYDPSTGWVGLSRSLSTICSSAVGFEVLSVVPAITDDMGTVGIREGLNDTLLSIPPIDLLPVTGVTNQSSYDVTTTYPWLTQQSQILGIYFQNTGDDYPRPYRTQVDWLPDADAPRLLLPGRPFSTGQTFYVKARRPAQSWIKTSGVWAADTDGLNNDSDEALPLLTLVRAQTLATIYRRLGARPGPDEYASYYKERESFWTQKAAVLRWWDKEDAEEDRAPKVQFVMSSPAYGFGRSYRG